MYSKDISKKVHSSYLLKAQQGQFTGCVAPFGYRNCLLYTSLTDEDVMDILKQAFSQSGMKEIVAESVKGRVAGESLTE